MEEQRVPLTIRSVSGYFSVFLSVCLCVIQPSHWTSQVLPLPRCPRVGRPHRAPEDGSLISTLLALCPLASGETSTASPSPSLSHPTSRSGIFNTTGAGVGVGESVGAPAEKAARGDLVHSTAPTAAAQPANDSPGKWHESARPAAADALCTQMSPSITNAH